MSLLESDECLLRGWAELRRLIARRSSARRCDPEPEKVEGFLKIENIDAYIAQLQVFAEDILECGGARSGLRLSGCTRHFIDLGELSGTLLGP